MPSKYCGNLPRCKNAWWCATDFRPSKNVKCFDAITNYDRIISKTPEELAAQIVEWIEGIDPISGTLYDNDTDGWLNWLKQEASDGWT